MYKRLSVVSKTDRFKEMRNKVLRDLWAVADMQYYIDYVAVDA